jgi:hypothetical protein
VLITALGYGCPALLRAACARNGPFAAFKALADREIFAGRDLGRGVPGF